MDITNKKISIIVACYNEESNILPMHDRLVKALEPLGSQFEIIYVDNDSADNSPNVYEDLCARDKRVKVIIMSRNFGLPQTSYFAGLKYCSGDCAILLDGDIQDPPELLPEFIKKWNEGFDVVYGIRKKRKAPLFRRIGYKLFYRLFKKLAYIPIPLDASDFGLIDRKVINHIISFGERELFIRGIRPYVGFRQTGIEYVRDVRASGRSSFSFFSGDIAHAKKLIVNFSYKPLEWISRLAFLVTAFAFLAIVVYVVWYFVSPTWPGGIPTVIIFILFFGAIQLLSISVIGEYLAKIFMEVKHRPRFIVKKILNDDSGSRLID
ncbi:MAG: glycosyltransferase family 2 protein [bacterium]|nr:glycosyltransferase family 2 protein [bacterium]